VSTQTTGLVRTGLARVGRSVVPCHALMSSNHSLRHTCDGVTEYEALS